MRHNGACFMVSLDHTKPWMEYSRTNGSLLHLNVPSVNQDLALVRSSSCFLVVEPTALHWDFQDRVHCWPNGRLKVGNDLLDLVTKCQCCDGTEKSFVVFLLAEHHLDEAQRGLLHGVTGPHEAMDGVQQDEWLLAALECAISEPGLGLSQKLQLLLSCGDQEPLPLMHDISLLCAAFHQSFVCELGGDGGGGEKRSSPHSHSVCEAGRRSREEVCA